MSTMIPYAFRRNNLHTPATLFEDDFFRPFFAASALRESFRVAVKNLPEGYELSAELPGVQRDQLSIDVDDGVLTITAEWTQEESASDAYVINERRYGKMQRSFNIDGVDEMNISASYSDGILKLNLPKKAEGNTARKIEIQ